MFRFVKYATPIVAMGLLLGFAVKVKAEDKPAASTATGTVNVIVQDQDGKGVEGATVRIVNAADAKHGHKQGDHKEGAEKQAAKQAAGDKPTPVKEGKTDSDGKCKLEDVPAGDYVVQAGLKGKGRGVEKLSVKGGDSVDVTVKLGNVNGKKK
jgi:hypothetical protein